MSLCIVLAAAARAAADAPADLAAAVLAQIDYTSKRFTEGQTPCVRSHISSLCPTLVGSEHAHKMVCVPIEPIKEGPLDIDRKAKKYVWYVARRSAIYKPEALRCEQSYKRRFYIDLGANKYYSSTGEWFVKTYPRSNEFHLIAFEANPQWAPDYKSHPEVEFYQAAAWVENTTLHFAGGAYSGRIEPKDYRDPHTGKPSQSNPRWYQDVRAIDLIDFLRRRVRKHDYLVLKMDIEGAEFQVVPKLIESGATELIDEMFLEAKANTTAMADGRSVDDALQLLRDLREAGVYAHQHG